jgi:hypothetical protein
LLVALALGWGAALACGQEMVTIPKARLVELERKEKELEALRAELGRARGEQEQLKREKEAAEARRAQAEAKAARTQAVTEPVIAHETPPLATLPPLQPGEVVDAMDLMNHYRADAAGAARRYDRQRLRVRGVVVGFDKPSFLSHYFILLQTTERRWEVAGRFELSKDISAAYPAKRGEEFVVERRGGGKLTVARVGQTVEIEGECKGLKDQTVTLVNAVLRPVE